MSEGAGRPSLLTDELCLEIRQGIIEGRSLEDIANTSGVAFKTFEQWRWRNYRGFADKLRLWRIEKRLAKVEDNIDILLDSEDEKVRANMTQWYGETAGKAFYSKATRIDLAGVEGAPVGVIMVPAKQISGESSQPGQDMVQDSNLPLEESFSLPIKDNVTSTNNSLGATGETSGSLS